MNDDTVKPEEESGRENTYRAEELSAVYERQARRYDGDLRENGVRI